jgi:hypothetical protein
MHLDKPSKRLTPFTEISQVERALSELINRHIPRSSLTTNRSRKPKQLTMKSNRNIFGSRRQRIRPWHKKSNLI